MMLRTTAIPIACAVSILIGTPPATQAAEPKTDADRLAGVWLFDAATLARNHDDLPPVWHSTLTVTGDSFAISKVMDGRHNLTGKVILNPATSPKTIDLKVDEFDLSESGMPLKIPARTLPGIYTLDGDRLTVCFTIEIGGKRPATFDDSGEKTAHITVVKAPAGFKEFPTMVRVVATGPAGQPAARVTIAAFMNRGVDPKNKSALSEWRYDRAVKTGADGTATMKFADLRFSPVIARDAENKRMAVASVSPTSLVNGEVPMTLVPECRVTGTVVSPELREAGLPVGWANLYALKDGRRVAFFSGDGTFDFVLPPGNYTLNAYGSDLKGKFVPIVVPAGRGEMTVEPIALTASVITRLKGRPAQELAGVVGWKGPPMKLADLKGKYVLLEFWGYWCGPCVGAMPVLIDLHEKFADKGLVVIGVHVDGDGEVDTAAKLDEKIATFKKGIWKGQDLPFSVALTSGQRVGEGDAKERGGAAAQYGILSYPTTILIDRDGNVVDKFAARDTKAATEQIEKLLNAQR